MAGVGIILCALRPADGSENKVKVEDQCKQSPISNLADQMWQNLFRACPNGGW